jgi:hypothetical protein
VCVCLCVCVCVGGGSGGCNGLYKTIDKTKCNRYVTERTTASGGAKRRGGVRVSVRA